MKKYAFWIIAIWIIAIWIIAISVLVGIARFHIPGAQ